MTDDLRRRAIDFDALAFCNLAGSITVTVEYEWDPIEGIHGPVAFTSEQARAFAAHLVRLADKLDGLDRAPELVMADVLVRMRCDRERAIDEHDYAYAEKLASRIAYLEKMKPAPAEDDA